MSLKRYILDKRVIGDLKKRSSIGIAFYIVLSFAVVFKTDSSQHNSLFPLVFLVLVNGISLIRLTHVIFFKKLENYNESLNTAIFIVSVLVTAAIWGGGFAYSMILNEEFSTKILMAICTVGLCSGGVVAFIPERRLSIVFNLLMLLPAFTLMMVKGVLYNLAFMIILYSGYLVMLTLRGNREYWDALENEAKLKDKTVELKRLSHTDVLTGIYNRRYFNEIFDFEWKRSSRDKTVLTIVMCDIDYFKKVNDTYGHIAGDEYLIHIAQVLNNMFKRDTDIVARYGGEEFVMLLSGIDAANVFQMAEDLRKKVADCCVMFNGVEIKTTMSFGIASCIPESHNSASHLITRADHALYRAKNKGRDRVEVDQIDR